MAWLNTLVSGGEKGPYRLPWEAEWEYACRAGTTTPFWWGRTISTDQANYDGSWRTLRVDSFKPNPWGLYQVHGNVWEWCEDNWSPTYENRAPLDAPIWRGGNTSLRVHRGGSFTSLPTTHLRSASRFANRRDIHGNNMGFRVARTL